MHKRESNLVRKLKSTIKEHGVRFPVMFRDFKNPTKEEALGEKAFYLTKMLKEVLWSKSVYKMKSLVFNHETKAIVNYRHEPVGKFIKIRPCGSEYQDKTYLGIFIGNVALGVSCNVDNDSNIVVSMAHHNPGIFVFELNKVILGVESWWSEIETPEDLKDITDLDINNVWYVQALKSLGGQDVQNN